MASEKVQLEYRISRVSQIHDYSRHLFTSVVGWFTFFITINYASIGWLATGETFDSPNKVLLVVAILFVTQNILGIIACLVMRRQFYIYNEEIREIEIANGLGEEATSSTCLPVRLYSKSLILMITALITILIAWLGFVALNQKVFDSASLTSLW